MEYLKWDKLGLPIVALVFVLGVAIGRQWAETGDVPGAPDRYASVDVGDSDAGSLDAGASAQQRQAGVAARRGVREASPKPESVEATRKPAALSQPARQPAAPIRQKPAPVAKPRPVPSKPAPAKIVKRAAPVPAPQKPAAAPKPDTVWNVPVRAKDAQRGPENAPATMVVFTNYTCPTCRTFSKAVDRLVKDYGKNLRVVIKHKVLPATTPMTIPASIAALAAKKQGKFWEFHNKLFFGGKPLSRETFIAYAGELGLNMGRFTKALDNKGLRTQVLSDAILANQVGAHSMPNVLVNGVRTRGAKSYEVAKALVEKQLGLAKLKLAGGAKPGTLYNSLIAGGREFEQLGKTVNQFDTTGSPALGPKNAKVQVVVFEDFQ